MLFIGGLNNLSREDYIALLAQLNAINSWSVINQGVQQSAKRVRDTLFRASEWVANRVGGPTAAEKVQNFDLRTSWAPEVLKKRMSMEGAHLATLSHEELRARFRIKLLDIAALKRPHSDEVTANAILHRAATSLGVDVRLYLNATALEKAVFEAAIRDMIEQLKIHLEHMEPEEEEEFRELLIKELTKLSEEEQLSIERAMGLDDLAGSTLISFLKTTASVSVAPLIISSLAHGGSLFLSIFIKAITALLGVSFSFGTYVSSTSLLSFSISIPFLLLAAALSGGLVYRMTSIRVEDELAKVLIVCGKARLLAK